MFPSPGSHRFCHQRKLACECGCHADIDAFDDGLPDVPIGTVVDRIPLEAEDEAAQA